MSRKKYLNKDIIQAIKDKFGSVEEFADKLGVTTQAIYSRVNNQNRKFLKELEGHGIVIGGVVKEPPVVYNACNNELAETKKLLSLTLERINSLEKENSLLKEGILNISVENGSLDQAIENLKRKIKK